MRDKHGVSLALCLEPGHILPNGLCPQDITIAARRLPLAIPIVSMSPRNE